MRLRSASWLGESVGHPVEAPPVAAGAAELGELYGKPPAGTLARLTGLHHARREIEALRARNAHLLLQIEDLSRREAQARRLAARDELTGLFNRRLMLECLAAAISEAQASGGNLGVVFVDLDGFKEVNDVFGHGVGDSLLVAVGARIAARSRRRDVVCRYGGDEFVVVLPGLPEPGTAAQIAGALRTHLAAPYVLAGVEISVTASIGLAVYPSDARDPESLLRCADASMYRGKSASAHSSALAR
jgi:diguanylate cyclase (GGDEF)-like protein